MSLYNALVMLGVSSVHYTRAYNASSGVEHTSYAYGGGPVPLLRPFFAASGNPPPVDLASLHSLDMRFLEATDALLDTPAMEAFFEVLATFPNARVVLTVRDPREWAASRRARHPGDRTPLFSLLGFDAPMASLSVEQSAMAFALWQRVVAGSVPAERLLVLDIFNMSDDELWGRLCAFVDRPLPVRDEAGRLPRFPHMAYGQDMSTLENIGTPSQLPREAMPPG